MTKLYHNERGYVIPCQCEELTATRRARVQLDLPPTDRDATLCLHVRSYEHCEFPLRVAVNGHELPAVEPDPTGAYRWLALRVPAASLAAGDNAIELWTDAAAMNAWSLGLDATDPRGRSMVSYDAGASWRDRGLGYLSALRGEYVVRLRLAEGDDPAPPEMVWEDRDHPGVAALRQILPTEVLGPISDLDKIKALSTWLATSWEHTSSGRAALDAPWDAQTIIEWGRARSGHNGVRPVVMCVHFAVAFVSACQAIGIAARCAAATKELGGGLGHFVAEAWLPDYGKWVAVDPNCDAMFWRDDVPLSLNEVQEAGPDLGALIRHGDGVEFQRTFPHMATFIDDVLRTGLCFRHRSVWPRADFLSRPDLSPPGHGSVEYCETEFVWRARDKEDGFGMFPHFADDDYFDQPPG